jgi:hypothetical protein
VVEVEDPESAKHESGGLKGLKSKILRVRSANREGLKQIINPDYH